MAGLPSDTRFVEPVTGYAPYSDDPSTFRPHIILISIDMVPPEIYRRDGLLEKLNLPNLRRLRGESASFENAFTCSPLCGPARATLLTGRYSYMTVNEERAHDGMAFRLRPDDPIFPAYLRSAGYITRHTGKCHVGADKFIQAFGENDHPWDRWAPPLWDDDEYHEYLAARGIDGIKFAREIRGLRQDRKTPGNLYGAYMKQKNGGDFPIEGTYPFFLADRASRAIDGALRQRENDEPIYMQLDFFAPHQPFMIPSGMEERARELRELARPPRSYYEAAEAGFGALPGEPKVYQTYRRAHGLYEEETMRDYIVANFLQMEILDAAIGRFLDKLRDAGIYDDAAVIFLADHGEMNGERALVDKGTYAHPKVARIPLWAKLPGGASAGVEIHESVSILDVAPTVLNMAGISPFARLDGVDLAPLLGGKNPSGDRDFIFEAGWHLAPNPCVAMQRRFPDGGHYLYAYSLADRNDELYDLADHSYRNLAGDERYRVIREEMIRRLGAFLSADARWRCYWHTFRVEFEPIIGSEGGDTQMFTPE